MHRVYFLTCYVDDSLTIIASRLLPDTLTVLKVHVADVYASSPQPSAHLSPACLSWLSAVTDVVKDLLTVYRDLVLIVALSGLAPQMRHAV